MTNEERRSIKQALGCLEARWRGIAWSDEGEGQVERAHALMTRALNIDVQTETLDGLKKQLEHAERASLKVRYGSLSSNLRSHLQERDAAADRVRELEASIRKAEKEANETYDANPRKEAIKEIDQLLKLINIKIDKYRLQGNLVKAQTLCGHCEEIKKKLAKACIFAGMIIGQPLDMEAEEWTEPTSAIGRVEQGLEGCEKAAQMLISQLSRIQQSIGLQE